jgi:hypothetical protein
MGQRSCSIQTCQVNGSNPAASTSYPPPPRIWLYTVKIVPPSGMKSSHKSVCIIKRPQ